ncbi:MAG: serine hydrolase domain-containing protein [Caulobacter sp.]|nr:serine hydrolase domain-containing protein [Caulobacter sp.]
MIWTLDMPDGPAWSGRLEHRLSELHQAGCAGNGVPGAVVNIGLSGSREAWTFCAGRRRGDGPDDMSPETGFHIASVGKAMTAALLLQLWERGRLPAKGLDTPIAKFEELSDLLAHIPVLTDPAAPVTLRHMLTHTSGLRDAFSDDSELTAGQNGGMPAPRSLSAVLRKNQPSDQGGTGDWPAWNAERLHDPRAGVLNWFIWGAEAARAPVFAPGSAFHYSDTAYMILALLVERLAGRRYGQALRDEIFGPLGMNDTFLAYDPSAPEGWRREVSDFIYGGEPAFSAGRDVSWDWGGGGQISTAADLGIFLRGFFSRRLFAKASTLRAATKFVRPKGMPAGCTGLGLGVRRLTSPGGVDLWGHAGAWSVQAFYAPRFDVTITGTFNQPMHLNPRFRTWVFEVADSMLELSAGRLDLVYWP